MNRLSPLVLISLIISISVLFILAYIVGQRRRTKVKTAFIYFSSVMFVATFFEFLMRLGINNTLNRIFVTISLISLFYGGVSYLYYMYCVTGKNVNKIFFSLLAFATIGLIVAILFGEIHLDYNEKLGLTMAVPSILTSSLVAITGIPAGCYGFFMCWSYLKNNSIIKRRKIISLLMKGMILSISCGILLFIAVPLLFPSKTELYLLAPLCLIIHIYFMYQAVIRYQFLSVDFDQIEEGVKVLLDNITEGAIVFDTSGEVVQCNKVANNLFGIEITSSILKTFIAEYDFKEFYSYKETELVKDNKIFTVLLSQSEIKKDERKLGKILIIRDITDEVEKEKKRKNNIIRMNQAEKMESIGQLAGGIAHDFNNMLTGIIGSTELLKIHNANIDEKELEYIDIIFKAAIKASELTSQLLAFSRKEKIESEPININKVVDDAASILTRTIDKQNRIEIEKKAQENIVLGDNSALQNAILNLGINASQSMKDGGKILIKTSNKNISIDDCKFSTFDIKPGMYIKISVSDSGCGIPKDDLKKIYEPFFTTKEHGKGTGLGLSSVYGTTKTHNGSISVSSELGVGTTFSIFLPCHEGVVKKDDDHEKIVSGNGLILIVDDEELILKSTTLLLESMGYNVLCANNGTEALEIFKLDFKKIDLVILDMIMPVLNGAKTFLKMKQIDNNCNVIISSGFTDNENINSLIDEGLSGFIQKPFKSANLSKIISEKISSKQNYST